jgi:hypothetical protein
VQVVVNVPAGTAPGNWYVNVAASATDANCTGTCNVGAIVAGTLEVHVSGCWLTVVGLVAWEDFAPPGLTLATGQSLDDRETGLAALVFAAVAEGGGPGLVEQGSPGNAHHATREGKDASGSADIGQDMYEYRQTPTTK